MAKAWAELKDWLRRKAKAVEEEVGFGGSLGLSLMFIGEVDSSSE